MPEETGGIPDRANYGDVSKIPLRTLLTYVDQLHEARRAGTHHDIRFGDRELFSWAGRKGLPRTGERTALFQQPLHSREYADFQGEIPTGYGAGRVTTQDKGTAFVTEAGPDKIKFTLTHKEHPEHYAMIRTESKGNPWLVMRENIEKLGVDFAPDYSPTELKDMGVYGEVYGPKAAPRLASLPQWPKHWYHPADPHGWLQWYKRYSDGRRMEDDTRQMARWKAFKARHGGKAFQENPTPRRAYALRNWGVDPVKLLNNREKRVELIKAMEAYRAKKYEKVAGDWLGYLNKLSGEKRPGLWANIRAKRARGENPAKPGDKDYPDKGQWDKLSKQGASSPAWQRSEGKNPEGGLNAKGRASYARETGGTLKAPVTENNPKGDRAKRQNSFCSRMCGMKRVNTGGEAKRDPDSRINKALRKWNCKCGAADMPETSKKEKEHPILRALLANAVGKSALLPTGLLAAGATMKMPGTGGEELSKKHLENFLQNSKIPKNLQPKIHWSGTPSLGDLAHGNNKFLKSLLTNALYDHTNNTVSTLGNGKLTPGLLAHELGHAQIQHGKSSLARWLQTHGRAASIGFGPLASLIATQKAVNDNDSNLVGAGKGALAGASAWAPMLLNEFDASRRGVATLLRSNLPAKYKLMNSLAMLPAFASYGTTAAGVPAIFGALTARAKRRIKEKNQKKQEEAKSKTAAQDMEWSRQVGGLPEMAGVFDALKAQVPKVQNAAYNFGGKAYDFLASLNKNKAGAPQIKPLVAGGQIR
jgi:hypothetical protein